MWLSTFVIFGALCALDGADGSLAARRDARHLKSAPPAALFAAIVSSCVATTIGFFGTAWMMALAAVYS